MKDTLKERTESLINSMEDQIKELEKYVKTRKLKNSKQNKKEI